MAVATVRRLSSVANQGFVPKGLVKAARPTIRGRFRLAA